MSVFCVVAAGAELPSKEDVGSDKVETVGTIYMKPNANWKDAGARFAAYFFEGGTNIWVGMTDADGSEFYKNANSKDDAFDGYYDVSEGAFKSNVDSALEVLKKYYSNITAE